MTDKEPSFFSKYIHMIPRNGQALIIGDVNISSLRSLESFNKIVLVNSFSDSMASSRNESRFRGVREVIGIEIVQFPGFKSFLEIYNGEKFSFIGCIKCFSEAFLGKLKDLLDFGGVLMFFLELDDDGFILRRGTVDLPLKHLGIDYLYEPNNFGGYWWLVNEFDGNELNRPFLKKNGFILLRKPFNDDF
ncbi:MAG: hypothetical protein ACTSVI_10035 [Promethearchaeota archaeon]